MAPTKLPLQHSAEGISFKTSGDERSTPLPPRDLTSEEKLSLQYSTGSIPFNATDEERSTFMPTRDSSHSLSPDRMGDFVFVTAASSSTFKEELDAIASIQTLMPQKNILFFDIGLKADEITKVHHFM